MSLEFPAATPHDEIEEVFEDIFFVKGSIVLPNGLPVSRNMTIVREDGDLTLINSVRLNDDGLKALDALGTVKHVVRIGAFHGKDDPFYVDRYKAELWSPDGIEHNLGFKTTQVLQLDGSMPFANSSYFHFDTSNAPEGLVLIEREGGIIVSCDAMQNWAETDHFFNEESAAKMAEWGFIQPAAIGVGWLNSAKPEASDFDRLNQLDYRHFLPSHGTPIKETAKEQFAKTFKQKFEI